MGLEQNYYITHFFNEETPKKGVITPLTIIVRKSEEKGIYRFGYGGGKKLSEKDLANDIKEGALIKLQKEVKSDENHGLYLGNDNNIYYGKVLKKGETRNLSNLLIFVQSKVSNEK